jgi:hypothetical protein
MYRRGRLGGASHACAISSASVRRRGADIVLSVALLGRDDRTNPGRVAAHVDARRRGVPEDRMRAPLTASVGHRGATEARVCQARRLEASTATCRHPGQEVSVTRGEILVEAGHVGVQDDPRPVGRRRTAKTTHPSPSNEAHTEQ